LIDSGARRLEEDEIDDEKYKRKMYDEGSSTCPKEDDAPWCKRSEDEGHRRYGRYGDTWDLHQKAQNYSATKNLHGEVCTRLIEVEPVGDGAGNKVKYDFWDHLGTHWDTLDMIPTTASIWQEKTSRGIHIEMGGLSRSGRIIAGVGNL
jgi:hypothetical protein